MASNDTSRAISGLHLRYVLTLHLHDAGESSVDDLVGAVVRQGFRLPGRPSKSVSDALRWEVRRGRVVRRGRARYAPGTMPRQTRSWMRRRVRSLHTSPPPPPQLDRRLLDAVQPLSDTADRAALRW